MITLDDTKTRIIAAAIEAVRQYGLEGVRIQNVSDLAGISAGAIYRHFESKDHLLVECFTYVDKQAAAVFEHLTFNPLLMLTDPMGAVKELWLPYFRFWTPARTKPFSITASGTARFSRCTTKAVISPISKRSSAWPTPSGGYFQV